MSIEARNPESRAASRQRPRQVLALLAVGTVLAFGWLAHTGYSAHGRQRTAWSKVTQLREGIARIAQLDEVLKTSVSMAIATGDARWATRYASAEAELESRLARVDELADVRVDVATREARAAVADLEHRALEAVRRGRSQAASAIVASPAYLAYDRSRTEGTARFSREVAGRGDAILGHAERTAAYSLAFALGIALCLLGAWPMVLWGLASSRSDLEREILKRRGAQAELERARSAAEAGSRGQSRFFAAMSHEIRQRMTAILGFTEVLFEFGDLESAPPERLNAVVTIHRNSALLLEILNDLLDLAKLEAGEIELEADPIRTVDFVEEIRAAMTDAAIGKGLDLFVDHEGAIPETIVGDPKRLRQVLINLIGNAVRLTDSGEIRVVVRLIEGPRLEIEVRDSSAGMTDEHLAALLRPFATDRPPLGDDVVSSLGISVSTRLVELMRGTIDATAGPQGAVFRIAIPLGSLEGVEMIDGAEAAAIAQARHEADLSRGAFIRLSGRVLVAEDGPDNQALIRYVLEKYGADVEVAENGEMAVERALAARDEGSPFDLILMDIEMPVMDGYEATRSLRQRDFDLPILALTAHATAADRKQCLAAGCSDFIEKPIDRLQLIEAIRLHLQKPAGAPLQA